MSGIRASAKGLETRFASLRFAKWFVAAACSGLVAFSAASRGEAYQYPYNFPYAPGFRNVMTDPNIVVIYWGWRPVSDPTADPDDNRPVIESTIREIGGTKWFGVVSKYYFQASPFSQRESIHNTYLPNAAHFTVDVPFTGICMDAVSCCLSAIPKWANVNPTLDEQTEMIRSVLRCGVGDEDTIYMVSYPQGVTPPNFAKETCANHHATFDVPTPGHCRFPDEELVPYIALKYMDTIGDQCGVGPIDSAISMNVIHEMAEAITDPYPCPLVSGWRDLNVHPSLSEIGDGPLDANKTGACEDTTPPNPYTIGTSVDLHIGNGYQPYSMWVQPLFDNSSVLGGRCSQSYVNSFDDFVRGGDNRLYHYLSPGNWESWGWPSAVTRLASSPSAITGHVGGNHVFVIDTQSVVQERWHGGGFDGWSSWGALPGPYYAGGRPEATARRTLEYDVYVTGYVAPYYADRVFWNRRSDTPIHGGSPQGWVSIGGPPAPVTIVSSPAVASWAPNRQDVFVVGSDGNMWHTATFTGDWSDHVGWSSWSHPTTEGFNGFAGDPDLASWGDQRLDLLVFDRQNPPKLWHAYWDHGAGFQQWFTWPTPSGKTLTPSPSIVGMGYGRLEVSVRENNGAIWHELYDDFDGFAPWQWAGGYAVGGSDLSVPW